MSGSPEARAPQQELAERDRDRLSRLAGGIAHETNNQMTVVLGFTEFVLRSDNLSPQQRNDLLQVRRAASRVSRITRQLLAFSRRQVLRPEAVNLDELLRDSFAMLTHLAGPEISVTLELEGGSSPVLVDRAQLTDVLLNLVLNARDATGPAGRITLSTALRLPDGKPGHLGRRWDPGTELLVLSVTDSGSGIDPAIRPLLFEPFFTTKPVGEGAGLGLSAVEGIVEQSGGDLWLESEPGRGTRVSIGIPVIRPAGIADHQPAAGLNGKSRMLLVEDEAAVRGLLERALGEAGFHVRSAADGEEALTLLDQNGGAFDLVLVDLGLPGMSGDELARQAATRWPGLRFLFTSGHPGLEVGQGHDLTDTTPFLRKPFSSEDLIGAIRAALG